ncbi:MAG: helix-turn-helix domain-containing protein [Candidatus Hydrogenedentota bacterium]
MRDLLTAKEAAEKLGVHIDTMRDWLRTGVIKGVKVSKARLAHWRVSEKELERFQQYTPQEEGEIEKV